MVLKRQSNRPQNKNYPTKQEYSNTHDHAVSNCRFFAVRVQRTNVLSCVCAFFAFYALPEVPYNVVPKVHFLDYFCTFECTLYLTMSSTQCTFNARLMFAH